MSYWDTDIRHWDWDLIGECAYNAICHQLQEPVTWGWSDYKRFKYSIFDNPTERVYHCSRGNHTNCRGCAAAPERYSKGNKLYEMTFLERIV